MAYRFLIKLLLFCNVLYFVSSCRPSKPASRLVIGTPTSYQLVWEDEFNGSGLPDATKWSYDTEDGCPDLCGWGNNERQYYTNTTRNVRQQDGLLIIEAHKEAPEQGYSSARMVTRGNAAWMYGRIEIRAKLPSGRGSWPAIWMLSEDAKYGEWPNNGEIDIMEHVGHEPDRVYATAHTAAFNHLTDTQNTDTLRIADAESAFHEYAIEWTPDAIRWYVDDTHYSTFVNRRQSYQEWPFDQRFYLILNIAVGGNWGGAQGVDQEIWPQQLQVDYVRIYQKERS